MSAEKTRTGVAIPESELRTFADRIRAAIAEGYAGAGRTTALRAAAVLGFARVHPFDGGKVAALWPAAGLADTEIRCLTDLESGNAEKEVQPRVQA